MEAGSLLGRDAPLRAVVDAIRNDRPVAVVGEAGIGKTSLVRAAAVASGRELFEGGGFATLAWLPYLALRRATALPETSDPARVARAVEHAVGPDVLFVDDLQWTDADTRAAVGLLLGRIAIVTAVRDGDAATSESLDLLSAHGVEVVRLDGLDRAAAMTLAWRSQPDLTPAAAERIVTAAGGNPLLIEELAVHGRASSSLERAIVGRLQTMAADERDAMELLSLAGHPLPEAVLGAVTATLIDQGLVTAVPGGLAVRHSLIAEATVKELDQRRREKLLVRLAELVDEPAARARHLAAAGHTADAVAVARAALAGESDPRARAVLLTICARGDGPAATMDRVRAARQHLAIGDPLPAIELLDAPLQTADVDLLALGAAVRAAALDYVGRRDEAWAVLEAAATLGTNPGSEGAVELAATTASVMVNRGHLPDAIAHIDGAMTRAGASSRAYRLAGHSAALRLYAAETADPRQLADAVTAAFEAGDGNTAAGRAMDLYYLTLAIRGGETAEALADEVARRLDGIAYHTRATELLADATEASIFAGHLGPAVVRIDSMLEVPLGPLSRQRLAYLRGLALGYLGHADDAERTFLEAEPSATPDMDGRGALLGYWSEASLWAGQASRALEQAAASLEFVAFNDWEFVLPSLARAWAEVELGRTPSPPKVEVPFRLYAGARPEHDALAAAAAGRHAEAAARFIEAADLWLGFHVPRELVCRWAAAESRRRAGNRELAIAELRMVLAAAAAIGFEPLAARVRRSLRLAGDRAAAAARSGPSVGLLTAREREILSLVERGLTNAEIARRMGLGRPTVARMLSNSMLKLGAESRAQAVILASEPV